MFRRFSLGLIYVLVGIYVAFANDYITIRIVKLVLSALLAIFLGRSSFSGSTSASADLCDRPGSVAIVTPSGAVAQLAEHLHGMQGVRGSNPLSSTTTTPQLTASPLNYRRLLGLPDCPIRATRTRHSVLCHSCWRRAL